MVQTNIDDDNLESQHVTNDQTVENISDFELNARLVIFITNSCGFVCMLFSQIPLIITSLYYVVNDHSCVYEPVKCMAVNLFIYFIVGIIVDILCLYLFILLICKLCKNKVFTITRTLLEICWWIGVAWTIVGSVMFWGCMDTSKCDKGIYTYVYAFLIIKYVLICMTLTISDDKTF